MSEITPGKNVDTKIVDHEKTNFLDLLILFAKHKRFILGFSILVSICAAAISLTFPNVYKSTIKILPPQQAQSGAAALLAQLGGVGGAAAGAAGIKNPNDVYIGMLKSRTIADAQVNQFNLKKAYDDDSLEGVRATLSRNTTISSGKDGLITIDVIDTDRKRAAQIANGYSDELAKLTKVLAVTEAAKRRLFFERELESSKNKLAQAEARLREMLYTHGVISVDSESRAVVETVARLRAQISSREIQLNAMQSFVTENNQEYKRLKQEIISARSELSKLENGVPDLDHKSTEGEKQVGLENIKILREVKYHQMMYELLAKQFEVARLDESKDTSIIQVLDKAQEAEKKFGPHRAIIAITSGLLAFFAALLLVFLMDAKKKALLLPENAERWTALRAHLRSRQKI